MRPVEIARKLVREMEENKSVSISRTYVPNEYTVWLSQRDHERFADMEDALTKELSGICSSMHGRKSSRCCRDRRSTSAWTRRSASGSSASRRGLVRPAEDLEAAEPVQGEAGHTMIYSTAERVRQPIDAPDPVRAPDALLLLDGKRLHVGGRGATIGRSRSCDVVVGDGNVSRQHAEVRLRGDTWVVTDLGSTNGVLLNGRPIRPSTGLTPATGSSSARPRSCSSWSSACSNPPPQPCSSASSSQPRWL